MKKTLLAVLLAALAAPSFAQESAPGSLDAQLAELNAQIRAKGAKWVAGETPLSRLSEEELVQRLGMTGLKIDAPLIPETQDALPPSLDWREKGFVSAVQDQGKCGSCWAFAMTAGLESNVLMRRSGLSKDVDLSEQVMVSCSGAGSCNGGTLDADFIQETGLPPEKYYAYTAKDGDCSLAQEGWQKEAQRIGSWGSVYRRVSALKSAVAKYGPLPTAFWVYEDFKDYKSGVYSYVTGKRLGGHAVLLVGFDDEESYFIVKNSWSGKWGEEGFFRIAYSEVDGRSAFGLMTIAYRSSGYSEGDARFSRAESSKRMGPLMRQVP